MARTPSKAPPATKRNSAAPRASTRPKTRDSRVPGRKRVRRKPEEAREHILSAASALMAAHGPDGVGLESIARSAGVSHALITHYFGTYSALTREVIRRQNDRIRARLLTWMFGKPPSDIDAWVRGYGEALSEPHAARMVAWTTLFGKEDQRAVIDAPFMHSIAQSLIDYAKSHGVTYGSNEEEAKTEVLQCIIFAVSTTMGLALAGPIISDAVALEMTPEFLEKARTLLSDAVKKSLRWPG